MSANIEMMDTSNIGDIKKELTGRARRKMSKMDKQPASMIVQEDSDARLNVSELVEKRRSELEAMMRVIKAPPSTRTALQRISRCKRRRASAHNLKRLPKSVRNILISDYKERPGLKSYKRRQLADREKSLKGEMIISESGDGPNRLSTHVFFAKRFHMIVKFGWHLPLCPTEKKLKHCMKICAGKVDGVVGFDFTFTRTIDCVFDSTLSKMILIGTLAQEFSLNSKLVVQREMHGDYVIAFVKKEDATEFATDLIMSKNGHFGGLELWRLHRCAKGRMTFPDDFPDSELGSIVIRDELHRMAAQCQRKPKSKNKFLHLNLLENSERALLSPPGVQFTDDGQNVDKIRLIAHGRGRIEQFATVACYPSGTIEEYDPYSVLDTKKPITGDFEGVGFVTSVAQDFSIGSNVAIATVKSAIFEGKPAKIIYRNLHWNHWRVAKVEYLKSDCEKSFNLIQ